MANELNSDNFGNKIKLIQKLDQISDAWVNDNIKGIFNILSGYKGLKWFVKDCLLRNKINENVIYNLNELINYKYDDIARTNISDGNDLLFPENIFDITDHVLIKILNYLDAKSLYNFEKTCKQGTYIARHPSSLYTLTVEHSRFKKLSVPTNKCDMVRFSKIKVLDIIPKKDRDESELKQRSHDQFHDFINYVSSNIDEIRIDSPQILRVKKLGFHYDKLTKIKIESIWFSTQIELLEQLNKLTHLEIDFLEDNMSITEINERFNRYNTISSLKYLRIKHNRSYPNISFIHKLLSVHGKTLECVSINHKEFHDIIIHLTREQMELKLDNITELSLTHQYLSGYRAKKTAGYKLMTKYLLCNNIEKLYVSFNKDFMPFRPTWMCNFINQCASNKGFKLLVLNMWLKQDTMKIMKKLFKDLIKTLKQTGNKISVIMHCWYNVNIPEIAETNKLGTEINDIKGMVNKNRNVLNWILNVRGHVGDPVRGNGRTVEIVKELNQVINCKIWNKIAYNHTTGVHTFMDRDVDGTFYFDYRT